MAHDAIQPQSIEDITQRLVSWVRRTDHGLARVEYFSEFSRQHVLQNVRQALSTLNIPFYEIELPSHQTPGVIVDYLNTELAKYANGVVSIHGFMTAFEPEDSEENAFRQLNMNRELLAHYPLRQIWWMLPVFLQKALHGMPDLMSWFNPRLRLTETVLPDNTVNKNTSSLSESEQTPRAIHQIARARYFIDRLQKASQAGAPQEELLDNYLILALVMLFKIPSTQIVHDFFLQFEPLINALKERSLSQRESPGFYNNLGNLYQSQGRFTEAETLYQKAYELIDNPSLPAEGLFFTTVTNANRAHLYQMQGRFEEAESLLLENLKIFQSKSNENYPGIINTYTNLGSFYQLQSRYFEAEQAYLNAVGTCESFFGRNHPATAESYNNLARLYQLLGREKEAETYRQKALETLNP